MTLVKECLSSHLGLLNSLNWSWPKEWNSCERADHCFKQKNQAGNDSATTPPPSTPQSLGCKEVSWYFGPSQPQWITSQLKFSICLLFTLHTSHQTTNYPQTTKSVLTQTHVKKKYTNIKDNFFKELVPLVMPLFKKRTTCSWQPWSP